MSNIGTLNPVRRFSSDTVVSGRTIATIGIIALAIAGRMASGWDTPLWFDETFSAVIANQPDFPALIDWCLNEIGGPVYYVLLWAWAHLFGGDAVALRSFSLLCTIAAPVAAWRLGPRRKELNLYWAALLALWMPAFDHASNARCYSLLLLVNTVQATFFLRLMQAPTRGRALAWTGLSALAILTHYQTAVLAGVQGILFLGMHRRAAIRCWPALVALIPMACWMAFHLSILLRFSSGGTWYPPIGPIDLLGAPGAFFESPLIGAILALGWIVAAVARRRGWQTRIAAAPDRAVAMAGVIAMAILLVVSTVKPSFTWRYATVFAPSILFGVAIWVNGLKTRLALAPVAVLAMFAASAAGRTATTLTHSADNYRFVFNLDQPSAWLAETRSRRLGFLWDSPTGTMSDPARMAEVAGYFLRRRDPAASVSILKARPGSDPQRIVADAVQRGAIDSLVWISDASVPGTLAPVDAGLLVRMGWQCRDFGRKPIALLACRAPFPRR